MARWAQEYFNRFSLMRDINSRQLAARLVSIREIKDNQQNYCLVLRTIRSDIKKK